MKFQSKKDETIIAKTTGVTNEETKKLEMEYLSGDNVGEKFELSESTLKRWWRKLKDEVVEDTPEVEPKAKLDEPQAEVVEPNKNTTDNIVKANGVEIDLEQLSKPYKSCDKPKYIPKPDSVVEYESKSKKFNHDLPTYEQIQDIFASSGVKMKRVGKEYIMLENKCKVYRQVTQILICCTLEAWEKFITCGLASEKNNDVARPVKFEVKTPDEWDKVLEVLRNE